jgi:hypothetical protein
MMEYWNDGILGFGPPALRAYASERKWYIGLLAKLLLIRDQVANKFLVFF